MDLIERLNSVFGVDPQAPALEFNGVWFSWQTVGTAMREVDRLLGEAGVSQGAGIAVLLRNQPGLLAAAFGVITSRRCMMPLNPLLPQQRLAEDIAELRAPVIIGSSDWQIPAIRKSAESTGAMGIAVRADGESLQVSLVAGLEKPVGSGHHAALPGIAINMITSGTTGKPKRVQLPLAEFADTLWAGLKYEAADPAVIKLHDSPGILWIALVHIGGMWTAAYLLSGGRKFALMERFDPVAWRDLIVKYGIRFVSLPPTALRMVLDQNFAKADFARVIAVRSGTSPLDPDLADEFQRRYGPVVLDAYGATEFAGGVAGWTLTDHTKYWKDKRGSVGRANVGVMLRVIDRESFQALGVDQPGLLEINMANGKDGRWVRTTDLACIDQDGFLFILGRADNMINRGGFKISPEAVCKAMQRHPAIREASVVALPDSRLGHVPVAAYELNEGAPTPRPEELSAFLRQHLKAYEIPAQFKVVDKLPRTPSLKVSQPDVKSLFVAV
jgi:acyl-CoA synthetase (AMP-forming)/AMP-acid ligase II